MSERDLLMIPGPTNVDPIVLRSMTRPTMSHTGPTFAKMFKEVLEDLGRIFKTSGLILPLAGSGTLAAEIGLANILEPEDRVLAITGGYFGDRLAELATILGGRVDRMETPWGSAVREEDVEARLSSMAYKVMLAVHVDTSTGVENPAKALGLLAAEKGVLFVLDTVCSMGGMKVEVDDWKIDVCFTGSQKALAIPPGLAIVSFNAKAEAARKKRKTAPSTYYGDIMRWAPILEDPTRYFATPAVNMFYALHQSCRMILMEGLEERFTRHALAASAIRAGLRAMGLRLLCEDSVASNTLTVVYYPDGIRDLEFRKLMAEDGVVVAGGLGSLRDRAFRIGHMGNVSRSDVMTTLSAVESSLQKLGYRFQPGASTFAANRVFFGGTRQE
jgi:alanine-glyoxylate transaminase/serine-glyoxylate transaminase/serine-pyruvate transaminase